MRSPKRGNRLRTASSAVIRIEALEHRRLLTGVSTESPYLTAFDAPPTSTSDILHTTARLSQARQDMAIATVGDLTLFAGGLSGTGIDTASAVVDIYNAATGQWSTATLSQARDGIAPVVIGHTVLFVGGDFDALGLEEPSAAVDIYNADTNQWSVAALSQARDGFGVATVGNRVIFAGGNAQREDGQVAPSSNVVDIYNASNGQWTTATLSQARGGITATTIGSLAIFAGGEQYTGGPDDVVSDAIDIYNSFNNQWSTATLSQARAYIAATTVDNQAIFAEGQTESGASNVVDIYDGNTDQWSTATLSQAHTLIPTVTVDDSAIFAGGYTGDGIPTSNVVDIYNARTQEWSSATLSTPSQPAATVVGNDAFFSGEGSTAVDLYDAATGTWSSDTLSKARSDVAAATNGETAIFAGGLKADGQPSAIVDLFTILTPILSGSISGPTRGSASVTITNTGTAAETGPYSVSVYASTSRTLDRNGIFLGKIDVRESLAAGQTANVSVPLSIPSGTAPGQYHLIAVAGSRHQVVQIASTRRTFGVSDTPPTDAAARTSIGIFNAGMPMSQFAADGMDDPSTIAANGLFSSSDQSDN